MSTAMPDNVVDLAERAAARKARNSRLAVGNSGGNATQAVDCERADTGLHDLSASKRREIDADPLAVGQRTDDGQHQVDAEAELLVDEHDRLTRDQLEHLARSVDRAALDELNAVLEELAGAGAAAPGAAPMRFEHGPAGSAAPAPRRAPGANLGVPRRLQLPSIDNPEGSAP